VELEPHRSRSATPDAASLTRRALRLEYATIAWNAFEGIAGIAAGIAAHSVSLTGWGLDSSIEVLASSVAAWQLRSAAGHRDRRALRLIGVCYLVVAVYVGFQSVARLVSGEHPSVSPFGMAISGSAVVVMAVLGLRKRMLARHLANPVLSAEAKFSLVDAALAATVLGGLVMYWAFGWWWADPVVAVFIALVALSEGVEGVRAEGS
jgi:divalent metal cation (Fe/Co/Zn/Cd) transporter